ncbi:MAG: SpoIIE family protein phosphatase, partial [Mycobacteriales bacterium]
RQLRQEGKGTVGSSGGALAELRVDALADGERIADARRATRAAVTEADLAPCADDAELVVSELVTNALLYGLPPVFVRLTANGGSLLIEVSDGSREPPVPPEASSPGNEWMTGRGLALVAAVASAWGVRPQGDGKTVWARLSAGPAGVPQGGQAQGGQAQGGQAQGQAQGGQAQGGQAQGQAQGESRLAATELDAVLSRSSDDFPSGAQPRYTVALPDVPTDLLLAAKRHVDNVIREFALAAAGAAAGVTELVPPHLTQLIEAVTNDFSEARQSIKRQAMAAAASGQQRTRLVLHLPASAASAGERYLDGLDQVDSYARAARLLTLATPPEHRAFRRWYVTTLVAQLRAHAAGLEPPEIPTFEQFLLQELAALSRAQARSDRAARLQAVSAALAAAATPEEVAAVVIFEGVAALGATAGALLVPLDAEHLGVPGTVGMPDELVAQLRAERRDAALPAAAAMRSGEPVWLESRAERDQAFPELIGFEPGSVAMCALPVTAGGDVLGALRFSFDTPQLFDDDARSFALALAAQTAAALSRARLFALERQARDRTAFLAEASRQLSASLEPAVVARTLAGLLTEFLADWAVVHLDFGNGVLHPTAAAHTNRAFSARLNELFTSRELLPICGLIDQAARSGATVRYDTVPTLAHEQLREGTPPELAAALLPSCGAVVPLQVRDKVIGAATLARLEPKPFTDEEITAAEDLTLRAAVAVANGEAFVRMRESALTLQRSLLPQQLPELPGLRLAWRYLPASGTGELVGGDWYDVLPLTADKVALVIGDVMGRGLTAAAVMGQLRAMVRAFAAADLPPEQVLRDLDIAVARLEQDAITTVLYAVLELGTGLLTVASAGHLPPLLLPPDGVASYLPVAPLPPLGAGILDGRATALTLQPGTMLLLYTDGLVESRHRLLEEGLALLQRAAHGAADPDDLCERSLAGLSYAEGDHAFEDDTALLAVEFIGGGG